MPNFITSLRAIFILWFIVFVGIAHASEIEIVGFSDGGNLQFRGGTINNYYTLEFAPKLGGPWTNWGSISTASITGSVMSLPSPFYYRIIEIPPTGVVIYATGTPVYVETDTMAMSQGFIPSNVTASVYQPIGNYLTNGDSKLGVGTTNPLTPIQIGTIPKTNANYAFVVGREIIENWDGSAHAFIDASKIDAPDGLSYNSYDAQVTISGTNHYGHYNGFQSRTIYNSSGNITAINGYTFEPEILDGYVQSVRGFVLNAINMHGTSVVDYVQGVRINEITSGRVANYAIYTAGATPSRFGSIILGTNVAISNWPTCSDKKVGSVVIGENYIVQSNIYAVGADTSTSNITVILPDMGVNFESILIRKFSASNILTLLSGTNILETLYTDGETVTYDWWPTLSNWYARF